jgi:hypothetical protein
MLQAANNGHDEAAYMFGLMTVEYNNSLVEVEEALVHVDQFIMPVYASRPSRYVSVINDNHLVSLMNFNEAKVN